jgi:hypothetical protein
MVSITAVFFIPFFSQALSASDFAMRRLAPLELSRPDQAAKSAAPRSIAKSAGERRSLRPID